MMPIIIGVIVAVVVVIAIIVVVAIVLRKKRLAETSNALMETNDLDDDINKFKMQNLNQ